MAETKAADARERGTGRARRRACAGLGGRIIGGAAVGLGRERARAPVRGELDERAKNSLSLSPSYTALAACSSLSAAHFFPFKFLDQSMRAAYGRHSLGLESSGRPVVGCGVLGFR